MKKDRLLHIITGLSTGGAERALYNVLSGDLAEHFDCSVLSLRDEGTFGPRIRDLNIPVHVMGMQSSLAAYKHVRHLRDVVKQIQPDVIQGWMYHGNLAATAAARFTLDGKAKVAWNIRHCLYSLSAEKLMTRQVIRANRWLSPGVDAILYNSRLSREQHQVFGFAASRGQVIPNGFDTELLSPDQERRLMTRHTLNIPEQARVIGHVARFHPMKQHAAFLHAAMEVMHQYVDVHCLLVGRNVNLENPVLADIVPIDLISRFHFVGERSDVPDLMRAMDIFCLSSCSEAFPNVLGEAMALGVPCVATDVGDSRDIIGDTGIIVSPADSRPLASCLAKMLEKSGEQRSTLGRMARARVVDRYALPNIVAQYQTVYERLVRG